MKTWMMAVRMVAAGVGTMAAMVTMAAAQPGHGAGAHGGSGLSDYRAVDRWWKEFDQVVGEAADSGWHLPLIRTATLARCTCSSSRTAFG